MVDFPYRQVEKALATTHGISDAVRQAGFRSMLSNLQKLGALGAKARVGRGAALRYGPTELHRLVLTLEFCELGIPPATAVGLVNRYWESKLKAICRDAERNNPAIRGGEAIDPADDIVVHLGGIRLRTGLLRGERFPAVPNINRCKLSELPRYIEQWMMMTPDDPAPPRALVVNFSARLRSFHRALADAHMDELRAEHRAALATEQMRPKARSRKIKSQSKAHR
jgi:hypothetical protein